MRRLAPGIARQRASPSSIADMRPGLRLPNGQGREAGQVGPIIDHCGRHLVRAITGAAPSPLRPLPPVTPCLHTEPSAIKSQKVLLSRVDVLAR